MKHKNDVSNMAGYLQVARIYSFTKEIKYTYALRISSFLFVKKIKSENNNFIKEIKPLPRQSMCEFSTASRVFNDLLSNYPKHSPQFSQGYEGAENMFYFLNLKHHLFFKRFFR